MIAKRSCYAQTQTAVFCFVLSVFFFCLFVLSASLCLALVLRLGKSASGLCLLRQQKVLCAPVRLGRMLRVLENVLVGIGPIPSISRGVPSSWNEF